MISKGRLHKVALVFLLGRNGGKTMSLEVTSTATQTVLTNDNILFTETPICGGKCIQHREGSGLITLRGITNQCRSRYKVTFGANVALPNGGTVEAISVAIALNGESVRSTQMIVTPGAIGDFSNIGASIFVEVPSGCCTQLSVKNNSPQSISVQDANLIVERVC